MVGDGSYLMLHTELVTAVAEGIKIIVVLIQNQGYASIGHLSETVGSERFGTRYRYLDEAAQLRVRRAPPVDLAANARSYGIDVIEIKPGQDAVRQLSAAVTAAKASTDLDPYPHQLRPASLRPRRRGLVGRTGRRRSPAWTAPGRPTPATSSSARSSAPCWADRSR